MIIKAIGGTAEKRAAARDAIRWALDNHLTINPELRLNVRFKSGLDYYGEAYWVAKNSYNSKSFTIVLSDEKIDLAEDPELFYETVLHEMVHVWQQASKIARFTLDKKRDEYRTFWKGVDMTKTPYSQQPWERQAYRMEKTLTKAFLASR